jgi:hypothetical protein
MSDGAQRLDVDDDDRRDGDAGAVSADEMIARMAAAAGLDPATVAHECDLYAWHMNELIAAHRRLDAVTRQPQDEWRQWAAQMIINDGRGGISRSR